MAPSFSSYTQDLQALIARDWRMLIGGKLVDSGDGRTMETRSPYDGKLLAQVPLAGPADVDAARRGGSPSRAGVTLP